MALTKIPAYLSSTPSIVDGGNATALTIDSSENILIAGTLSDSAGLFATQAYVTTSINSLIDSAPGALNTLNELAAAMGDDASFSTTVTNSIATKLPLAGGTLTGNLIIDPSAAGAAVLGLERTGAANQWKIAQGHTVTDYLEILEGSSTRLTIKNGGNVGIGTTSPDAFLQIEKDNSNSGNQFSVADTEGASAAVRTYTHGGDPSALILNHYYAVGGSGNEYMRYADFVANVGNGAGTTMRFITKNAANDFTTGLTLDNNGNATFSNEVKLANDKKITLGNSDEIQFKHHNSGYGHLENTGTLYIDAEALSFRTDNSSVGERLNINAAGAAAFSGTVSFASHVSMASGNMTLNSTSDGNQAFRYNNAAGTLVGQIYPYNSRYNIQTYNNQGIRLKSHGTGQIELEGNVVINEDSGDLDFRIESNDNQNMFFVDGTQNRIGIGQGSPADKLHITGGNLLFDTALEIRMKDSGGAIRTICRTSGSDLEYGWSSNGPVKFMGGGAYTERMRIHTDGHIKIGNLTTSATSAPLFVAKSSTDVQAIFGDNNSSIDDPSIRIIGRDTANSAIRYAFFGLDADVNHGFIGYNAGAGGFVNALNFDTSGKVGIGTASPQDKLQIEGGHIKITHATGSSFRGINFGATVADATDYSSILWKASNGEFRISANPSSFGGFMSFYSNAAESMRITSAGDVGIGCTPGSGTRLEIRDAANSAIMELSGTDGRGLKLFTKPSNWPTNSGQNDAAVVYNAQDTENAAYPRHIFQTGGTERMRIQSTGVGIGTTSPDAELEIERPANTAPELRLTAATVYTKLIADDTTGYSVLDASHALDIREAGADIIRVGSGTTTMLGNLYVNTHVSNGDESRFAIIPGGAGDNCTVQIKQDDASTVGVYLQADGPSWFTGGIVPGNSGTAAANTLDDYEEGTWTPTIVAYSGTNPTVSMTANGTYTKIGRLVTVFAVMSSIAVTGTKSGYIQIGGLPFTVVQGHTGSFSGSSLSFSQRDYLVPQALGNSWIGFLSSNNGAGWSWETNNAWPTSAGEMRCTYTYEAA